jgi:biotin--protein ligase
MEGTFARIMNSFESKWEQFIEEKGFQGLMDEYHGRWLHSYAFPILSALHGKPLLTGADSGQEVTLTTTDPHTRLRIQSITPDHGLLRCIPLDPPTGGRSKSSSGLTPLYDRGDFGGEDRVSSYAGNGGGSGKAVEYVDLQPDGNSFDLMSGLIKRKV